ncbi:unnamed protein product [Triticum turgidum subsp. durum]|uniref:Protein kinase domain-containing protein n=1 Tax=Triticum turgidum subsp. durum TaxID=4567 RepID=A0A9R1B6F7_TRITD|nr:unnamed protein product [Triticum turgidum subsp. durum]
MRESDRFVNEAITHSRLIHKNIVRLIGCCVEVDNPMLVYEFFSKDSLHEILHSNKRVPLNLAVRLSIAAQSAGAIAYMHSALDKQFLHGDVKSANILLDDQFVPKISNFGISSFVALDCNLTRMVTGDMSYMDPVYLHTGVLTEQNDVYNFGVVMLELLTRRGGSILNLINDFFENHKQGWKAAELFDKEIVTTEDLELLHNLAEIVVECLDRDVRRRPTMVDVAERLSILNQSR